MEIVQIIIRILLSIVPGIGSIFLCIVFQKLAEKVETINSPFTGISHDSRRSENILSPSKVTLSVREGFHLAGFGTLIGVILLFGRNREIYFALPSLIYGSVLLMSAREDRKTGSFYIAPLLFTIPVYLICLLYPVFSKTYTGFMPYVSEYLTVVFFLLLLTYAGLSQGDAFLYLMGYCVFLPLYEGAAVFALLLMMLVSSVLGIICYVIRLIKTKSLKGRITFTTQIAVGFFVTICVFAYLLP